MKGDVKNALTYTIIGLVVVFFIFLSKIVTLFTDYWWFDALGFKTIFLISLQTKIALFFAAAIIFFLFLMLNIWIASKFHNPKMNILPMKIKVLVALILSVVVGAATSTKWFVLLQYLKQTPFNLADPIFMKDVAFYVFSLPFMLAVWKFAMTTLIITTILVALDYFQSMIATVFTKPKVNFDPTAKVQTQAYDFKGFFSKLKRKALVHITILASFVFILLASKHYLTQFSIMYSEQGIVVGAGYTDVVVFLPIIKLLMIFAAIIVVLFYVWLFFISKEPKLRKRHIVGTIVVLYLIFAVFGPTVIPGIVQTLRVSPNELNLEKPYIENNIKFTKIAYGLDGVQEKDFSAAKKVTAELLENASETLDNVRLLDWRPLKQTYKQTQEIRLYYDLSGIDIDRYTIGDKYTQVMLAPREMDQRDITANAQTWVNLHEVYTHGFGAVVSPVNEVTKEGLPNFLVKNIPPVSEYPELEITQPRVYYGEKDNNYVVANTKTEEFDYPQGTTNQYVHYDGKGGVKLDSFFKKLMMALKFKDIKLLLSSDIEPESKIMFSRQVQKRIKKITPFLELDEDPYLVIVDGRMKWIQDAYTVTGNYPYSHKFGRINYIRNAVKIVVDAYDGNVIYYIADMDDPLVYTYAKIFPKQFRLLEDMPAGLKEHIRYPEDLFKVQSNIYSTYHMNDPTVFYNKEDAWQIPHEIYGTGQQVNVEPYYIIIKLPGESKEEFVLMTSFTPIKKDNMISWFAARSDNDQYGNLLLYKFPKDKLVYGPLQIEAKFDQDSEISQQLTLWSQQGSRVTRGNLLVIPIEDSILYIEPLYLQAESGQLPQLKRVLVSDGERVVMEESLSEALEVLFGKVKVVEEKKETVVIKENPLEQANEYYNAIQAAMKEGDWSEIGDNFDKLGEILQSINVSS